MRFSWNTLSKGPRYAALAAVVAALVGGYLLFGRAGSPPATLIVTRGDFVRQVSVSGAVTAADDVDLGFAASGRILGIYATVGQHVEAGGILAETENGDLVASVRQKAAGRTQAEAKLAALRSGARPEEVAVAEAAVASAASTLADSIRSAYTAADDAVHNRADAFFTNSRTTPTLMLAIGNATLKNTVEYDRAHLESTLTAWSKLLLTLNDGSPASVASTAQGYAAETAAFLAEANAALNQAIPDQSVSASAIASYQTSLATGRSNLNVAVTTLSNSRSALVSAEKDLILTNAGSTPEDILAAEAAVASAAADVESAQAALRKTRVIAPFSGIVTRMDAKPGEIVSPTTSEIALQSDGIYQLEVYIPEVSIAQVAPGQDATTTLDAYGSGVAFPTSVVAVDPAETMKNGVPTYKTTLVFRTADPRIRSGMTANVLIVTGLLHNAIVIPAGAVGHDATGTYVFVVAGKSLEHRVVETSVAPALGQIEITAGLSPGELISLAP